MRVTVAGRFPLVSGGEHPLRTAVEAWRGRGDTSPEGALHDAALAAAQTIAQRDLLALQEEAGVDLPSEGYIPIYDEWFALAAVVDGVQVESTIRYLDTNTYYHRWRLVSRPRRRAPSPLVAAYRRVVTLPRSIIGRSPTGEARAGRGGRPAREPVGLRPMPASGLRPVTASAPLTPRPVKPCLFGPYTVWAYARKEGEGATPAAFEALVDVWAAEVADLAAAGAQLIQLDESLLLRPAHRADLPLVAGALRRLARAAPGAGLILHLAGGAVGDLLPPLLDLPVAGLGLDFSDVYREPNLVALRAWHGEKLLQAGVANAREIRLETPQELRTTLQAVTSEVPPRRCLASPSTALLYLPRHAAVDKLRALAAAAHEALPA